MNCEHFSSNEIETFTPQLKYYQDTKGRNRYSSPPAKRSFTPPPRPVSPPQRSTPPLGARTLSRPSGTRPSGSTQQQQTSGRSRTRQQRRRRNGHHSRPSSGQGFRPGADMFWYDFYDYPYDYPYILEEVPVPVEVPVIIQEQPAVQENPVVQVVVSKNKEEEKKTDEEKKEESEEKKEEETVEAMEQAVIITKKSPELISQNMINILIIMFLIGILLYLKNQSN